MNLCKQVHISNDFDWDGYINMLILKVEQCKEFISNARLFMQLDKIISISIKYRNIYGYYRII